MATNGRQQPGRAQERTAVLEADEILDAAPGGMLEQTTKGEFDIQIATAKRFPRSIQASKDAALAMATLDEETAASCFYVLPKRKGSEKAIEGPSARLAEIIASAWGHMFVVGRIVEEGDRFVVAYGGAWDLQSNNRRATETRRRITGRDGGRYSDDMIGVTSNAAIAIATRNAVFATIPRALWNPIYLKCREVAVGTAETLGTRRAKMLEYFQKLGVEPARVFALLEIKGVDDITLEHVAILRGLATAIKEGDTSIDEAFPPAGTVHGRDPVDEAMALLPEVARAQVVGLFEQLKMNRGQRLVQLRAWKEQPDKLVEVLAGMLDAQKAEGAETPAHGAPHPPEQARQPSAPKKAEGAETIGTSEREARSREMPSQTSGAVGGAAAPSAPAKGKYEF